MFRFDRVCTMSTDSKRLHRWMLMEGVHPTHQPDPIQPSSGGIETLCF